LSEPTAAHERTILLLALAAFSSAASMRACDAMLPALAQDFGATTAQAARAISLFAMSYGLIQMFYGPLGDRYGKLRVIALAAAASVAASLGAMLSVGIGGLLAFRALGGALAAAIIPLSMAWIGDQIAYEHRQPTLARFMMGQMLGLIGGQFVGGAFADHLGWRWTFGFLAVTFALSAGSLWAPARAGTGHHGPGGATHKGSYVRQIGAIVGARWPRVIFATVGLEGFAVFGALAFVPLHLHHRFGVSLTLAGIAPGAFGIGGLAYAWYARRLVARLGEAGLARLGGALLLLGLGGLALGGSWLLAIPENLLMGVGFYMLHNTLQTNATQMAPASRGTAVSLFASCFFLGQAIGVAIASALADTIGTEPLFAAAALLSAALGLAFAQALRRRWVL
jgi:MFS transporter, YNFM family, putative membrane transport protein